MADAASSSGLLGIGSGKEGLFGWGGTGFSVKGAADAVTGLSGLVGGIMGQEAYRAEADLYGQAAFSAFSQAETAEVIGGLEAARAQRTISLTESAQRSAASKNGLAESGSVADLLRESVTQGAQTIQAIDFQTELKADQYRMKAYAAQEQQAAAKEAAGGSLFGGILKGAAGIAQLAVML